AGDAGRADAPVAVILGAEQPGEARGRVEPGQAEPVDRAIPADQRRGLHVADERVVLDQSRHRSLHAPSAGQPYRPGRPRARRVLSTEPPGGPGTEAP